MEEFRAAMRELGDELDGQTVSVHSSCRARLAAASLSRVASHAAVAHDWFGPLVSVPLCGTRVTRLANTSLGSLGNMGCVCQAFKTVY